MACADSEVVNGEDVAQGVEAVENAHDMARAEGEEVATSIEPRSRRLNHIEVS